MTDASSDLLERPKARPVAGTPPEARQAVSAPRNRQFEELLCRAVSARLLVELRYDNDAAPRLFAPHTVYRSTTRRVNVGGTQVENPSRPLEGFEHRVFEVALIRTLRLTDTHFRPDAPFDPEDPRYVNGVICAVNAPAGARRRSRAAAGAPVAA
jgi:hypothetical protein